MPDPKHSDCTLSAITSTTLDVSAAIFCFQEKNPKVTSLNSSDANEVLTAYRIASVLELSHSGLTISSPDFVKGNRNFIYSRAWKGVVGNHIVEIFTLAVPLKLKEV